MGPRRPGRRTTRPGGRLPAIAPNPHSSGADAQPSRPPLYIVILRGSYRGGSFGKRRRRVRVYVISASARNKRDAELTDANPESLIPVLRPCVRSEDPLAQPDGRRR